MDTCYNLINYYFIQTFKYFYDINKLIPYNPTINYIENYKKSLKIKKLPLIYTNPKWDKINKSLIWNSFNHELELAKKKPHLYINIYGYNKYYVNYKKCTSVTIQYLRWNKQTKKLEWSFIYKK